MRVRLTCHPPLKESVSSSWSEPRFFYLTSPGTYTGGDGSTEIVIWILPFSSGGSIIIWQENARINGKRAFEDARKRFSVFP
jgi:hypothetical protein